MRKNTSSQNNKFEEQGFYVNGRTVDLDIFNLKKNLKTDIVNFELNKLDKNLMQIATDVRYEDLEQVEQRIKNNVNLEKVNIIENIIVEKDNIQDARIRTEKLLNKHSIEERVIYHKSQLEPEKKEKELAEDINMLGLNTLEERVEGLKDKKEDLTENRINILKIYFKGIVPSENFLTNNKLYYSILSVYSLVESVINFETIQLLKEAIMNVFIIPLTLLISLSIALGAHYSGKFLRTPRTMKFLLALMASIFFLGVVIFLRLRIDNALIFILLNIGFYLICLILSYYRAPSQLYFINEKNLNETKNEKAKLVTELAQKRYQSEENKKIIKKELTETKPEELAKEEVANLEDTIDNTKAVYGEIDKFQNNVLERIKFSEKKALDECKAINARTKNARKRFKSPLDLIKNFRENLNGKTVTILLLIFILTSCTSPAKTDAVILLDITNKHRISTCDEIFKSFKDIEYGQIVFSTISDKESNIQLPVYIKKPVPFLFQVDDKQNKLKDNYSNDFEEVCQSLDKPSDSYSYSYVYESLINHIIRLLNSDADNKLIYILGDCIQHTENLSFYDYRQNPENLLEDYDSIVKKLELINDKLKDVTTDGSITITVIYDPLKRNDRLFSFARRFWLKYFHSKNIEMKFMPNIEVSGIVKAVNF